MVLPNSKTQTASTKAKHRRKITYTPTELPSEGYVRLPSVLLVLGISKSSFFNGIREGRFPEGKLLSPRCRAWPVDQIRALLK